MTNLSSHCVKKKIFIHEDNCQRESDGELYTVTNITYMADGLKHTLTLFSGGAGVPEFIQTNERIVPDSFFDEDNTDDETG
jgi:hypothetical protein